MTEDDLKRKLSEFTEDSTHRTVTDAEKTKWNNKAEKSYVDSAKSSLSSDITKKYNALNNAKANKADLSAYVKKDGNKVLSDNNFTNALLNKLNSVEAENTKLSRIMNLAEMIFDRKKLWESNNLYKHLNGLYDLGLSSSINSLKDFQNSKTAINLAMGKSKLVEDIARDPVTLKAVLSSPYARDAALRNQTQFNYLLKSKITRELFFTDKYRIRDIFKNESAVKAIGENYSYEFIQTCPYVYSISCFNSEHNFSGRFYVLGRQAGVQFISSDPQSNNLNKGDESYTFNIAWNSGLEGNNNNYDAWRNSSSYNRWQRYEWEHIYPIIKYTTNTLFSRITTKANSSGVSHVVILDLNMIEHDIKKES